MTNTWLYGLVALSAAVVAMAVSLVQRFGMAPIAATTGSSMPAAATPFMTAKPSAAHDALARKADGRVPPRGRRR